MYPHSGDISGERFFVHFRLFFLEFTYFYVFYVPGCPWPNIAFQVQNRGLKHQLFPSPAVVMSSLISVCPPIGPTTMFLGLPLFHSMSAPAW